MKKGKKPNLFLKLKKQILELEHFSIMAIIAVILVGSIAPLYIFAQSGTDTDGDGLPDQWETENSLDPNDGADVYYDNDDDGAPNFLEYVFNTNPQNDDTDFDGIKDGTELVLRTNPIEEDSYIDTDQDGDTNAEEINVYFTDPLNFGSNSGNATLADTDADGIPDSWEILFFGAITESDSPSDPDSDGIPNFQEHALGTNPLEGDTDVDDMNDLWEYNHFTNPTLSDGSADLDGDGYTNFEEYLAGTNPAHPGEKPAGGNGSVDSDNDGIPNDIEESLDMNPNDASDAVLDLDSDGLINVQEYFLGTMILVADSDGDGMDDKWETDKFGKLAPLDPNNGSGDPDHDGSTNLQEYLNGTNPGDYNSKSGTPDSNGTILLANPIEGFEYFLDANLDGLRDGWQIQYWASPTAPEAGHSADPDSDGASNMAEYVAGTDPTNPDTDGDTLLDPIETVLYLNPLFADGNDDFDGDDILNFQDPSPYVPASLDVYLSDSDGDEIADYADNCPNDYNPGQEDSNNNGIGDACDQVTNPNTSVYTNNTFEDITYEIEGCPTGTTHNVTVKPGQTVTVEKARCNSLNDFEIRVTVTDGDPTIGANLVFTLPSSSPSEFNPAGSTKLLPGSDFSFGADNNGAFIKNNKTEPTDPINEIDLNNIRVVTPSNTTAIIGTVNEATNTLVVSAEPSNSGVIKVTNENTSEGTYSAFTLDAGEVATATNNEAELAVEVTSGTVVLKGIAGNAQIPEDSGQSHEATINSGNSATAATIVVNDQPQATYTSTNGAITISSNSNDNSSATINTGESIGISVNANENNQVITDWNNPSVNTVSIANPIGQTLLDSGEEYSITSATDSEGNSGYSYDSITGDMSLTINQSLIGNEENQFTLSSPESNKVLVASNNNHIFITNNGDNNNEVISEVQLAFGTKLPLTGNRVSENTIIEVADNQNSVFLSSKGGTTYIDSLTLPPNSHSNINYVNNEGTETYNLSEAATGNGLVGASFTKGDSYISLSRNNDSVIAGSVTHAGDNTLTVMVDEGTFLLSDAIVGDSLYGGSKADRLASTTVKKGQSATITATENAVNIGNLTTVIDEDVLACQELLNGEENSNNNSDRIYGSSGSDYFEIPSGAVLTTTLDTENNKVTYDSISDVYISRNYEGIGAGNANNVYRLSDGSATFDLNAGATDNIVFSGGDNQYWSGIYHSGEGQLYSSVVDENTITAFINRPATISISGTTCSQGVSCSLQIGKSEGANSTNVLALQKRQENLGARTARLNDSVGVQIATGDTAVISTNATAKEVSINYQGTNPSVIANYPTSNSGGKISLTTQVDVTSAQAIAFNDAYKAQLASSVIDDSNNQLDGEQIAAYLKRTGTYEAIPEAIDALVAGNVAGNNDATLKNVLVQNSASTIYNQTINAKANEEGTERKDTVLTAAEMNIIFPLVEGHRAPIDTATFETGINGISLSNPSISADFIEATFVKNRFNSSIASDDQTIVIESPIATTSVDIMLNKFTSIKTTLGAAYDESDIANIMRNLVYNEGVVTDAQLQTLLDEGLVNKTNHVKSVFITYCNQNEPIVSETTLQKILNTEITSADYRAIVASCTKDDKPNITASTMDLMMDSFVGDETADNNFYSIMLTNLDGVNEAVTLKFIDRAEEGNLILNLVNRLDDTVVTEAVLQAVVNKAEVTSAQVKSALLNANRITVGEAVLSQVIAGTNATTLRIDPLHTQSILVNHINKRSPLSQQLINDVNASTELTEAIKTKIVNTNVSKGGPAPTN